MMEKSNSNNERRSDQKRAGKNFRERHKEILGMEVPEGYFAASKKRITDAVSTNATGDSNPVGRFESNPERKTVSNPREESGGRIFGLKKMVAYPLAASILLLIALAIGLRNDSSIEQPGPEKEIAVEDTDYLEFGNDFLVTSLLVDDAEIDRFANAYLVEQVIVRAELSEQELENIFINSLFVDDSLVDEYLEESLVDQVVL